MSKKQDYKFLGILYPDSTEYDCDLVLDALDRTFTEWAYIRHDRDVTAGGEQKKPHYHWVGRRLTEDGDTSPCPLDTIVNGLELPEKYRKDIEFCKSWKRSVRYLVHIDDVDKFQYDVSGIVSNFEFKDFFSDMKSSAMAYKIFDYICSTSNLNFTQLTNWCIQNGCWAEYRRSYSVFATLMRERNHDENI